jgi:hypothetical protein
MSRPNTYYRTCRHCGANLDPGEKCDCQEAYDRRVSEVTALTKSGLKGEQLRTAAREMIGRWENENAPAGVPAPTRA